MCIRDSISTSNVQFDCLCTDLEQGSQQGPPRPSQTLCLRPHEHRLATPESDTPVTLEDPFIIHTKALPVQALPRTYRFSQIICQHFADLATLHGIILLTLEMLLEHFHQHLVHFVPLEFGVRTIAFWICLLYTSPSPRDATLSRMPSSA